MVNPDWFWPLAAGYFVSLVLYFAHFEFQNASLLRLAKQVASWSLAGHMFFILALLLRQRPLPFAEVSEFAAPLLILLVAFFMEWRSHTKSLMLFSLPIALVLSVFAIFHWRQGPPPAATNTSTWFWLHIAFMLAGLVGLVTAVSSAVMYLLQSAQLKSKDLGKVFLRLPSLHTLDRIHFRALVIGVVFFSLGILGGIFRAKGSKEMEAISSDPKVVLSSVTCVLYWLILSLRLSALRRGQKIALSTVIVSVLLLGSYYAPSWVHSQLASSIFKGTS